MRSAKVIVVAMLVSYGYNREKEYMIRVCEEVKKRVIRKPSIRWTDEGNIIYGTLILLYGNYGTSPRSGWFENEQIVKEIIDGINEVLEELKK